VSGSGNFAAFLPEVAARFGAKAAVIAVDRTLTYAELEAECNRLAAALRAAGIGHGDRVATMLGNSAKLPLAFFAILKVGAAAAPFDVTFKAREAAGLLDQLEAAALIVEAASAREGAAAAAHARRPCRLLSLGLAGLPEAAWAAPLEGLAPAAALPAAPQPLGAEETALVCYTSGSTGRPKGAEITHGNLWAANRSWLEEVLLLTPDDVAVTPLPLAHSYGLNGSLSAPLMAGATVVVLPRFDPAGVVEAIRAHRATVFFGVATMYRRLVELPGDLRCPSLQMAVSGAADMPLPLAKEFQRRVGAPVVRGYGTSEIFRAVTFRRGDPDERPERIGRAAGGAEVRFVDAEGRPVPPGAVGEMEVRGPTVMRGYSGDPEENAVAFRDGWFRTGDLARIDGEGYVSIAGRKKDTILRGGYSVFPREVEDVLLSHPGVAEAVVVGVPDERLGQEVKAVVVPRNAAQVTAEDLIGFCKARLAHFKYPRIVEFSTGLPRVAVGKIKRSAL
jgi:long-chain acyl-CoA synthetase